jgi:hypothetical protein
VTTHQNSTGTPTTKLVLPGTSTSQLVQYYSLAGSTGTSSSARTSPPHHPTWDGRTKKGLSVPSSTEPKIGQNPTRPHLSR